jgi:hypothetical protein
MINVPIVTAPAVYANMSLLDVLNTNVEWTTDAIAALQEETRYNNNYQVQCGSHAGTEVGYPDIEEAYAPEDPCQGWTTEGPETTTQIPGTSIDCDFEEILVHPFPAPCTVEFLCRNLTESIIVNSCGFIDFDPRMIKSDSSVSTDSESETLPASFYCDFKEILVHPFPAPCRVEFLCYNLEELITVNNCGFIDFDP